MGLYLRGEKNDQMVDAVSTLCGGLGNGLCCGALLGATCMLGLFDAALAKTQMIPALLEWFEDEYASRFGGVNCADILGDDPLNRTLRCPALIENTYLEAKEILSSFGFEVDALRQGG
jgi:hypothetical protein